MQDENLRRNGTVTVIKLIEEGENAGKLTTVNLPSKVVMERLRAISETGDKEQIKWAKENLGMEFQDDGRGRLKAAIYPSDINYGFKNHLIDIAEGTMKLDELRKIAAQKKLRGANAQKTP